MRLRQRRDKDAPVEKIFLKQVYILKVIDIDRCSLVDHFLVKSDLVVLGQEVLLEEDVGQTLLLSGLA